MAELKVGDKVTVNKAADGWSSHFRQAERPAPFEAEVVGFTGADRVVVEADGLRYSLRFEDVS